MEKPISLVIAVFLYVFQTFLIGFRAGPIFLLAYLLIALSFTWFNEEWAQTIKRFLFSNRELPVLPTAIKLIGWLMLILPAISIWKNFVSVKKVFIDM
jgi:hypothetical protein